MRRTCRKICAWVSKGRGKASWDIKQGRLAQNCFCSECVLSYRHQKSNAIVDVVLISKIVINIDFCTESHYVATTCMNVNWAPGHRAFTGYKKLRMVTGPIKHLSHWCDKGKRSLVPSKITVINVVFCIISSRLNLQLPLRVSNSRFVQNFPSIMYISTVLKSASPVPEHPLKKVSCAGSSFTRRTRA